MPPELEVKFKLIIEVDVSSSATLAVEMNNLQYAV